MTGVESSPDVNPPAEGLEPIASSHETVPTPALQFTEADGHDAFDHERLVSLVDGLERDIALIESAMVHVEAREFTSANAALDVLDGVASA